MEGGRGGAARRGDHVPQLCRVHAGLLREERAALERLDHQVVRDVAREAQVHGRVDERLHDQEHIGRPGPADRRGHGHELLVLDLDLGPRLWSRAAAWSRWRAVTSGVAYQTVMPGRAVRGCWACSGRPREPGWRQGASGRARDDADDQLFGPQDLPARAHAPQHLGLDAQHDDVGALDRLGVRLRGPDAVLPLERLPALGARVAGDDVGASTYGP